MLNQMIFIFYAFICSSCGFLLEGSTLTPVTSGTLLTDKHYNLLMDLIIEERASRRQLETYVTQMRQQMIKSHESFTKKLHDVEQNSVQTDRIINQTEYLEKKFAVLERDLEDVKSENKQLGRQNSILMQSLVNTQYQLASLVHGNNISDVQTANEQNNITYFLKQELNEINIKVNSVIFEASARKQDFIALFQEVENNTKDIIDVKDQISKKHNNSLIGIQAVNNALSSFQALVNDTIHNFDVKNKTQHLEKELEKTNSDVFKIIADTNARAQDFTALLHKFHLAENVTNQQQFEINVLKSSVSSLMTKYIQISDKALLSAWTNGATLSSNQVIPFSIVQAASGIKDLSEARRSGKFICEKAGFYLISVFVRAHTSNVCVDVFKQTHIIAQACKSGHASYETFSATVVKELSLNDSVYVKTSSNIHVESGYNSVFTIVQIK